MAKIVMKDGRVIENPTPEQWNEYLAGLRGEAKATVEKRFSPSDETTKRLVEEIQRQWEDRLHLLSKMRDIDPNSDENYKLHVEIMICDNMIHSFCFNNPQAFLAWMEDRVQEGGRIYGYVLHLAEKVGVLRLATPAESDYLDYYMQRTGRLPPGFRAQFYRRKNDKNGFWYVPAGTKMTRDGVLVKTDNEFEEDVFEMLEFLRQARKDEMARRRPVEVAEEGGNGDGDGSGDGGEKV